MGSISEQRPHGALPARRQAGNRTRHVATSHCLCDRDAASRWRDPGQSHRRHISSLQAPRRSKAVESLLPAKTSAVKVPGRMPAAVASCTRGGASLPRQCRTQQGLGGGLDRVRPPLRARNQVFPGIARRGAGRRSLNIRADAKDPLAGYSRGGEVDVRLRGEAEAPFRPVRLVIYGFSVVSASVGALVSFPQLLGALGGSPNALPIEQVLQNVGINLGAVALFGYLFAQDKKAEAMQLARLGREESLGAQYVELAGGKLLRLRELRSFARVVVIAGTSAQVQEAVKAAEPFKKELVARGVMLITVPIFDGDSNAKVALPAAEVEDKKYLAAGVRLDGWREWFEEQMGWAKVQKDRGLYVGLRLDGRVRASGKGCPPWAQFAVELAPMEGMWKGFFDGMDGVV